jgi:transcriptional regulator with XRE-family HTH domain
MLVGRDEKEYRKRFARRLRALREVTGYNQTEFAKELGVGRVSLNRYELGVQTPSVNSLWFICKVLGITIDDFLEGVLK